MVFLCNNLCHKKASQIALYFYRVTFNNNCFQKLICLKNQVLPINKLANLSGIFAVLLTLYPLNSPVPVQGYSKNSKILIQLLPLNKLAYLSGFSAVLLTLLILWLGRASIWPCNALTWACKAAIALVNTVNWSVVSVILSSIRFLNDIIINVTPRQQSNDNTRPSSRCWPP